MAKRKKSYRRAKSKIPLLPTAGMVASGYKIYTDVSTATDKGAVLTQRLTGYDINGGAFQAKFLFSTYGPVLGGMIASKIMTKFGINRMLKDIPYIKL